MLTPRTSSLTETVLLPSQSPMHCPAPMVAVVVAVETGLAVTMGVGESTAVVGVEVDDGSVAVGGTVALSVEVLLGVLVTVNDAVGVAVRV